MPASAVLLKRPVKLKPVPLGANSSERGALAADQVNRELMQSRFPLNRICCECDDHGLTLTGSTSRYYYVQIALETALRHAGEIPVMVEIQVVSTIARPNDLPAAHAR